MHLHIELLLAICFLLSFFISFTIFFYNLVYMTPLTLDIIGKALPCLDAILPLLDGRLVHNLLTDVMVKEILRKCSYVTYHHIEIYRSQILRNHDIYNIHLLS